MIRRGLVVLVAAVAVLVGAVADAADGGVECLYVLDHDKPQSATLRYAPASYE